MPAILALAGTLLPGQNPPRPAPAPTSAVSPEEARVAKEDALGARLAADVRRQTTIIAVPEVTSYVERVGRHLAAVMPLPGAQYSFSVIQDDPMGVTHEPLALPGGYVFVPARLLLDTRDEAEFAGMLAHGMWQAASGRVSPETPGPVIYMGGLGVVPLGVLPELRAQVRQADFMAAQILSKAGYDPRALVRYIARVQPDGTPDTHSARPPRAERIAGIEDVIARLPAGGTVPTAELNRIQEQLRPLLIQPAPSLRTK